MNIIPIRQISEIDTPRCRLGRTQKSYPVKAITITYLIYYQKRLGN